MNKKDAIAIGDIIALRIDGDAQPNPNTILNMIKAIIELDPRIKEEIRMFDNGESILCGFLGESESTNADFGKEPQWKRK
jgi:hypothetical protein